MIIIGAGMAGLLAAGMLRDEAELVIEAQSELPHNHTALLRFRSSVVGDVLNIPFKKVSVMKAVEGNMNPVAAMLAYSIKSNGSATMRSSISAIGELDERYIAPTDLVQQMANKVTCSISFGNKWPGPSANKKYISTMPMPVLMALLNWHLVGTVPEFMSVMGYNITADLVDVDAYCTLYIPDKLRQENRISITGNKLTIEVALPRLTKEEVERTISNGSDDMNKVEVAIEALGLTTGNVHWSSIQKHRQTYAKILPIDETIRRDFIVWASEEHNVWSLGRFATWRPGLLLDDLVQDVRVIQKLVRRSGASYDHKKRD